MSVWRKLVCLLLVPSIVAGCRSTKVPAPHEEPAVRSPQSTDELVAFVERAATELRAKGTGAFGDFAKRGSIWNHDDTYLFVIDARTNRILFHGVNPKRVGVDLRTVKGAEGRAFGHWGVQALAKADHTWLFYKWARPGGGPPTWKASYLVRVAGPGGEPYILGSGVYSLKADRRFVVELVDMAAERLERDGRAALKLIRDPKGPFVYAETHVFVINTKGDVLADALNPQLQGKNQINLKSADGRPLQRDLIELIKTEGAGWRTGYLWARPGGGAPGHKDIYMRRVTLGRQTLGVGSGLYVD